MDSARASGRDAFVFVQHMSRISEPSYSDSSSVCADSGFGTGGHRPATRFTSTRRVGPHKNIAVEASIAVAKDSMQLTPMTVKARMRSIVHSPLSATFPAVEHEKNGAPRVRSLPPARARVSTHSW
jgi:hypothetical protein